MITITFYFLLWPGEYTGMGVTNTPFRFADVLLFSHGHRLSLTNASDATLHNSHFATLTFTNKKNGVHSKVIGLARSGHPYFCPILSLTRWVLHLRHHAAPTQTPLATTYLPRGLVVVTAAAITDTLQWAATLLGPQHGFLPADISTCSLRASGAMALLCARVYTNIIQLLGHWHSNAMLRYLHVQAEPVMHDFAAKMLAHGTYVLHPNQAVPMF